MLTQYLRATVLINWIELERRIYFFAFDSNTKGIGHKVMLMLHTHRISCELILPFQKCCACMFIVCVNLVHKSFPTKNRCQGQDATKCKMLYSDSSATGQAAKSCFVQ